MRFADELGAAEEISKLRASNSFSEYIDILHFFQDLAYEPFLDSPSEILIMLLTMSMGILGSLLTMTWSFLNSDPSMTVRRFLFLPFVGMMSALIVLVFLKAGQLGLTGGNAQDTLNPFVISFVGICSGLTSELAYARIAETSRRFFKSSEQPRWGVNLQKVISDDSEADQEEMAKFMLVGKKKLESIIATELTANSDEQRLAAAYLKRPVRELFSDQPVPQAIT